jgi:SAM-dependent methyltransferase
METRTSLSYCKLCELEDFRDPGLRELIRDMRVIAGPSSDYPDGIEHRKAWEVAMTVRALRDLGALRPEAELLGVGAGQEATIFWLTRYVRRVFATDLYLQEDSWSTSDSGVRMLLDPREVTTMTNWNPRRLVVQHMDGRELRYEDDSFDGIFSSGSIEHFGNLEEIRRSVEEMYRVLKPGGVASLSTEYRLGGPPGVWGTVLFDEGELREVVLEGMEWELASPLDLSLSEQTLSQEIDFGAVVARTEPPPPPPPTLRNKVLDALGVFERRRKAFKPDFTLHVDSDYPHIIMKMDDPKRLLATAGDTEPRTWTSVHLALVKPSV